jgi:hypothetical protein
MKTEDSKYCFRHQYNLPCQECARLEVIKNKESTVINRACPPNCKRDIELALLQKLKELGYGKEEERIIEYPEKSGVKYPIMVFVPLDIEATMKELEK